MAGRESQTAVIRMMCAVVAMSCLACVSGSSRSGGLEEGIPYRLKNAGWERLGEDMCVDISSDGSLDTELDSRPCFNLSGQYWIFTRLPTPLRHLPTYRMTTSSRGDGVCLTIDGTLLDHRLRLAPCADSARDNQLWIVTPMDGRGKDWEIVPYLEELSDAQRGFMLVVDTPPEGDGRPYIDTKDYVGKGYVWHLAPVN